MHYSEIIRKYEMHPHEKDGGWLSVVFDNEKGGNIYYLLGPNEFSRIHRIKVDEMWHFFDGVPLRLYLFHEFDRVEMVELNSDDGDRQRLVCGGCWMGACPSQRKGYSFLGCSVWGKFRIEDVEYAEYNTFVQNYPSYKLLIKTLIPNT